MQRPDPGVELLIGYFVLQPVQAVLPEVEFHSFLQLPFSGLSGKSVLVGHLVLIGPTASLFG
jgi:hypothetical protein